MSETTTSAPKPSTFWPEHNAWYAGVVTTPEGDSWRLVLPTGLRDEFRRDAIWGEQKDLSGACDMYDGLANTKAMAAALSTAALLALAMGCYIPSRGESLLLFTTLRDKLNLDVWHGTSTQYFESDAWVQHFNNGFQSINHKSFVRRFRFVRRLPLWPSESAPKRRKP